MGDGEHASIVSCRSSCVGRESDSVCSVSEDPGHAEILPGAITMVRAGWWRQQPNRRVSHNQTVDSKTLLTEALRLSPEERAALAGELIQSLDVEIDPDAEAAWSADIRARIAQLDAGTAKTSPWSEARRRIHAAAGRGPRPRVSPASTRGSRSTARWYAERRQIRRTTVNSDRGIRMGPRQGRREPQETQGRFPRGHDSIWGSARSYDSGSRSFRRREPVPEPRIFGGESPSRRGVHGTAGQDADHSRTGGDSQRTQVV